MEAPKAKGKGKGRPPPPPALSKPPSKALATPGLKVKAWPKVLTKAETDAEAVERADPIGETCGSVLVPLSDDLSASDRVREILIREPVIENTPPSSRSNVPRLDPFTSCNAVHGTTLAAALSALRNTDGRLVSVRRLEELGNLRATGATPECYLEDELTRVVFAADLQFGQRAIETAERYARRESGIEEKLKGTRTIRRSEAACIPVVVIGDLADPKGIGAKLNEHFLNLYQWLPMLPAGHPLHGKSVEEVKNEFADQIIGEWMDIRMVFVAHPTDPEKDPSVVDLVKELVQQVAAEQGRSYSHIHVGSLRAEVAVFKEVAAGKGAVTSEDIQRYLYDAAAPLT